MTQTGPIDPAEIIWRDDNTPFAPAYDDIYFAGDGVAETRHVFIDGNDLPARFRDAKNFTIGEIGFGTGLNFLTLVDEWHRAQKPVGAQLHFVSVEGHPFSRDDFLRAHAARPAHHQTVQAIADQYPPMAAGIHRINIAKAVSLTLLYGDALSQLKNYCASIDAWFLDGFAPSKNPALWADELMAELARLSSPGATFATFTVAGAARRALSAAGFEIEKRKGFGKKREMLTGHLATPPIRRDAAPWFRGETIPGRMDASIAIIGAGIAGASLAHSLRARGLFPVVFDGEGPASGASGNAAGLIMPRLDADRSPIARFNVTAFVHTVGLLEILAREDNALFHQSGGELTAADAQLRARQKKIIDLSPLPRGWIEDVGDGLRFPTAGVVDPPRLVHTLLGSTKFETKHVTSLERTNNNWLVHTRDGSAELFDIVVIANGADALRFSQCRTLPLSSSAGQIEIFPDAPAPPSVKVCGAYSAPMPSAGANGLVIGATHIETSANTPPVTAISATRENIESVAAFDVETVKEISPEQSIPRASIRCVTPDQTPVVGPVPDWGFFSGAYDGLRQGRVMDYPPAQNLPGLFILSGLGSRGLVTAPLCAEFIAARISGAPRPVAADIEDAINPARFFIRALKRKKGRHANTRAQTIPPEENGQD